MRLWRGVFNRLNPLMNKFNATPPMSTSKPYAIADADIIRAVEQCYERGERDLLEGGVHRETVANQLGVSACTLRDRLRDLAERGCLEQVTGADPDSKRPRQSYRPTDVKEFETAVETFNQPNK